jgi:flagellar protein FliS
MYAARYSANQYRNNSVNTSPEQLIVMCYDGMLRFLKSAMNAMDQKNVPEKVRYINKTLAIVEELQSTLNFEKGGEIAVNLDRLYSFFSSELMQASLDNDLVKMRRIHQMCQDLRESWAKVAADRATQVPGDQNYTFSG